MTQHVRTKTRTFALIVGALTAGALAEAGVATAEPSARSGSSTSSGYSTSDGDRDQTGMHSIDPFGFHHSENDPRLEAQHQDAQRDYFRDQNQRQAADTGLGGGAGAATWARVPRPDGDGWTVCRPQASWCG
ncbi:hypothetical protein [Nocardia sp. NPDC052566]|uniref:hypothetical protein n=1 Tax=Nocardia sp. NPDC052566 TaxID=3364330 RepID=UPI0037CA9D79